MVRLIGIDGDKGAGKDTLAEVLVRQFGFTRLAFAQPLKDMLSEIFLIAPITFEDRVLKEQAFTTPVMLTSYHINRILDYLQSRGITVSSDSREAALTLVGAKLHSPREMMQIIGTELVRTHVGYETWVTLWSREQAKYEIVVAPDARFKNERDAITLRCGKNVLIKRPELISADSHASENNHGKDSEYDAIVTNTIQKVALQSEFAMWYTHVK